MKPLLHVYYSGKKLQYHGRKEVTSLLLSGSERLAVACARNKVVDLLPPLQSLLDFDQKVDAINHLLYEIHLQQHIHVLQ